MGITAGYTVADYLIGNGTSTRRESVPPPHAWAAYRNHHNAGPDLLEAGRSARTRGLLQQAESLFRKAVTREGGTDAYGALSDLLENRGESELATEMLTQWAAIARGNSRLRAAASLETAGRENEAADLLRAAIADGETDVYMDLAELLRWVNPEEALEAYRDALAAGDEEARLQLVLLLYEAGREDEADEVLLAYRKDVGLRNEQVRVKAAMFLTDQGREDEALRIVRELADEGSFLGYQMMGDILTRLGRASEAVDVLRAAVQRGHTSATDSLARVLYGADRLEEAEAAYRAAAEGYTNLGALEGLVYFLADNDRPDEAISILREAMAAGNRHAREILGDILEDQCRDAEAQQVWREAIADGDDWAWVRLGKIILDFDHSNDSELEAELIDMTRADEAIRIWQQGIDEGAGAVIRIWLGRLLELCGRLDEAEAMWRQGLAEGDDDAMQRLANVLDLQGRHEESEALYAACGIHANFRNRLPDRPGAQEPSPPGSEPPG